MQISTSNLQRWWTGSTLVQKLAYRAITLTAMKLLTEEMLIVSFSEGELVPSLVSPNPWPLRGEWLSLPAMTPDQWWARSSPEVRIWTYRTAMLVFELFDGGDKVVRVMNSGKSLSADLVWSIPATN